MNNLWFIPIGFFIGAYGTLIGAGGGFILVPLLLFLSPSDQPSLITAASLSIILVNAASGTLAYVRMKRISYKTGVLFSLATIPGAVIGSYLTGFIPRKLFGIVFGVLMIGVAVFLSISSGGKNAERRSKKRQVDSAPVVDIVRDRQGNTYTLSFNMWQGMGISLVVGLFSSLVGIGGGLIHVPVLTYLFDFPVHVATATSHFILVFTALAGVVTHILDGTFPKDLPRLLLLAVGVVGGAQLGAFLSRRVSAPWIVVGLAVALGLVGVRLIVTAL
jgi:hypothetical protein